MGPRTFHGLCCVLLFGALLIVSLSPAGSAFLPEPVTIGTRIAGTFADATGHSAQSHLVYAANSGVWWLFTLTSTADSTGGSNHLVYAYRSSGPDLSSATWIAAGSSPGAAAPTAGRLGGGRSLGVGYVNNAPLDVVHLDISMAYDGQSSRTAHLRALVGTNAITWDARGWQYYEEGASSWTLPHANTVGVSSGKFIHTAGPLLQQEVDANVRRSLNADAGAEWTPGFTPVSVIDTTMVHENNAFAFAALANDAMLAVYDNGQGTEPALTNLRYKKSNADGSWPGVPIGGYSGGDGDVFPSDATINQNDWTLVRASTANIMVFRANAAGGGVDAAAYGVATNTWAPAAIQPPALAPGQSLKPGAGLFSATDGTRVWVFGIIGDAANSVAYTRYDGAGWSAWTPVPGTDTGTHNRNYIAGYAAVGAGQIGLIWTEGASPYDVVVTSLTIVAPAPDTAPPSVSLTAPLDGSVVTGLVGIEAAAADDVGVAGVRLQIDGIDRWPEDTIAPYAAGWDSRSAADGDHTITAIARDRAGNTATATIKVLVSNPRDTTPPAVALTSPAGGTTLTGTVVVSAAASDDVAVAGVQFLLDGANLGAEDTAPPYEAAWNTTATPDGTHTVAARARDTSGNSATSAGVTITIENGRPPAIDAIRWADQPGSVRTIAVNSLTTAQPNELIVAFVSLPWRSGRSTTVSSFAGGGLTWVLVRRTSAQRGTSEIWRAFAAAPLSNVTVRATLSQAVSSSMTVVSFSNVDATGSNGAAAIGATASASASAGAPAATLVTTRDRSWVFGVGTDPTKAIARTVGPDQALVHQYLAASADTYWVQRTSGAIPLAGTRVTINDTAPTTDRYALTICEIRGAS